MTADLPAIRARLAAADPARVDWPVRGDRNPDYVRAVDDLFAHARSDLAALCDEVERLREVADRVREIHALHVSVWGDGCDACVDAYTEQHVPYPCPTIRVLDGVE